MNINLHIERLILEGIPLSPAHRPQLQAAAAAELSRLLAAGGLSPALLAGGALPFVPAAAIQLDAGGGPAQWGTQIAQAVYSGLGENNSFES
jgi:hypothetical protein